MDDIYDGLENFDYKVKYEELQTKQDVFRGQILKLVKEIQRFGRQNDELRVENNNLKQNISSLYKTAIAEISRKDRMINELRTELNEVVFRTRRKNTMDDAQYDRYKALPIHDDQHKSVITDSIDVKVKLESEEKPKTDDVRESRRTETKHTEQYSKKRHRSRSKSADDRKKHHSDDRHRSMNNFKSHSRRRN